MNQTSESAFSEPMNPWKQPSSLPKPARGSEVFAAVLFLIASAVIPFSLVNETVAVVGWSLLIAGGYVFTGRSHALMGSVIAVSLLGAFLPGVLLPLQTVYYPAVGASLASVCVGCCAGGYFQTVTKRFWVLPLLSLIGVAAAYAVTGDWLIAVMGLALLPAVLLLSVATHMGEGCTSVICYCIGGLLGAAAVLAALWIRRTYGSVSPSFVRSLTDSWKENFVQAQIASRGELIAMIDERIASGELTEEAISTMETLKQSFSELMSDGVLRRSMDSVFQLLPAIAFLCCAIPSFLCQRLLNASYATNGMGAVVTPESEFFTMSLPSAVLYAVSLFLSVLSVEGVGFLVMVASNLSLILLPGMLLLGFRSLKQQFGSKGAPSRKAVILIVIVMLCCATSGMLYLIAFLGAYMRIMQAVHRAMKKKMGGNGGSGAP